MKKKATAIILTTLFVAALGGTTVFAAGNGRQGHAGTVTGNCTGVLSGTLDHCLYNYYNECDNYNGTRNSSTCICGGSHTFTDQDGDGICDYRDSTGGRVSGSGQNSTSDSGQNSPGGSVSGSDQNSTGGRASGSGQNNAGGRASGSDQNNAGGYMSGSGHNSAAGHHGKSNRR